MICNMNIDKKLSQDIIKTDSSIKKISFSCAKKKILKSCTNIHTNNSINENNYIQNNYVSKKNHIKNCIYKSINNTNLNYKNKDPYLFNSNRSLQTKHKKNNNQNLIPRQKTQRKNLIKSSRKKANNHMNRSLSKKDSNRNISRQNQNEIISKHNLKPFKSENKITVVHSKVNKEINNLFNGLSDKIVKDPEVHNKIESLIKDIKDIQQVVHRKTQTHFRPRKQNNMINSRQ